VLILSSVILLQLGRGEQPVSLSTQVDPA
jgi:hypothetical protein